MNLYDTYMSYCEPFHGSTKYHRWSILSCIAATLERRCWFSLGGLGKLYPNMYIVLCGGPGTGKTIASSLATSFIKRFNESLGPEQSGVRFGPDKVTPAALLKRFQRCTKSIKGIPGIGTVEQSCMYLHSTELSTFIKDIGGGSISDDLLKLYDCDDYFEKELVSEGIIKIPKPGLNILADTTPSFLGGFLPREESGTGLTARMIFATELGRVRMDEHVPDGDNVKYQIILQEFQRIHQMMGVFTVEQEAGSFWSKWWKDHQEILYSTNDGSFIKHFYARKPVHVRKVAMCLSAARDSSRIIKLEDLKNALEFINELEPTMAKSFGVQDFKHTPDLAKMILDAVPFVGRITKQEILNALYHSGAAGAIQDFDATVATVVQAGLVNETKTDKEHFFTKGNK